MSTMICPNCDSQMDETGECLECGHIDGDENCVCDYCLRDEIDFEEEDWDDEDEEDWDDE